MLQIIVYYKEEGRNIVSQSIQLQFSIINT